MEYITTVKNFIRSGYYTPLPADAPTQRRPNPKGFFANERTFLSWVQFAVVLGGLAVSLLNFSNNDVGFYSACLFSLVSFFIMGYAYYTFRLRAHKLQNKEPGFYDDNFGPRFLIITVIVAAFINFWLNYAAGVF